MKIQFIRKSLEIFMFAGFILLTLAAGKASAQSENRGFQFGPGTPNPTAATVRLNLPARTKVLITATAQRTFVASGPRLPLADIPVVIEVFAPGNNSATPDTTQFANATVVNALTQIPVLSIPGVFNRQQGCPDSWRVRVRTQDNAPPPVRVFGSITFAFTTPGTKNLDMEGSETINLNRGARAERILAGQEPFGTLNRSVIAGTGIFHIKAKWHTDPADFLNFGKFFPLNVALLRPDGTVAASQRNYSQHRNTRKLDFTYRVTPQDARMPGVWKLRVTSEQGNPKIVDFDIERGLDLNSPSFNSTFTAQCS
jgi:hypothetical protein